MGGKMHIKGSFNKQSRRWEIIEVDMPCSAPDYARNVVGFHEFTIREGAGAKFEQAFATKQFKMQERKGFQYMSILRRVSSTIENDDKSYIILTSWQDECYHAAWWGVGRKPGKDYIRKTGIKKGVMAPGGLGHAVQKQFYAANHYPTPKRDYIVDGKDIRLSNRLGGFGSVPDMTGETPLPADLFFSIRWYNSMDAKKALNPQRKKLTGAKGLRWVQILELPEINAGEARVGMIAAFDNKAAYDASPLPGFDAPDLGEGLYEGVLSVENPKNMADCPPGWKCPF